MVSLAMTPIGNCSWIQPWETQYAMRLAIESDVGIGVPSKYFDFPVLSLGTTAAVTLKRANLVSPQRTKKLRNRWSAKVRVPRANAATAGATPNEICRGQAKIGQQISSSAYHQHTSTAYAYQVCQRIQLLTHQRRLLAPSRNSTIHEVKEKPKWHKRQGGPYGIGALRVRQVSHGRQNRHDCSMYSVKVCLVRRLDINHDTYIHKSLCSCISRL